jgi:magnesium-transporting ATPase (P-type)
VEAASAQAEESRNIAFSSSGCIEGEAVGLVIRAGDGTMIGKIAKLATATGGVSMSTLERDIHHFVSVRYRLATAVLLLVHPCRIRVLSGVRGCSSHHIVTLRA